MKIFNPRFFVLAAFLIGSSYLVEAKDPEPLTKENINLKTEEEIKERVDFLENRVSEIKDMDFSSMTRSEKKDLKKELKKIKKEMGLDSRVSISIGALIIIILLLIIIF